MAIKTLLVGAVGIALLAGCANQTGRATEIDRTAMGAAAGGVLTAALGGKESDVYKGAAVGALGGALCDDVGVAACR